MSVQLVQHVRENMCVTNRRTPSCNTLPDAVPAACCSHALAALPA